MNDPEYLHNLLLTTNSLLHVSSTGAGPSLYQDLWEHPGASGYLVGYFTPYARTQLHSFLGHPPEESYVCEDVSYDLAMASYIQAAEHQVETGISGNPVGLGITAAVASTRLPKGLQQAFICVITKNAVLTTHLEFEKAVGGSARIAQDRLLANRALDLLERALVPEEGFIQDVALTKRALELFYRFPVFNTDGTRQPHSVAGSGAVYLPATLNPIHDGHRSMAEAAEAQLSASLPERIRARYLVSSSSPHKGSLSIQEMLYKAGMLRAERWKNQARVVEFTRDEPLFIDKARKRPNSTFLIGADTMERLLDPTWGVDINEMCTELKNLGVLFLVMGRVMNGEFKTVRDINVPWPHSNLFRPLGGRVDISSTEIRGTKCP